MLSAVYRTGQNWGLTHLTEVLTGKESAKVRDKGHHALSVFGLVESAEAAEIAPVARALVVRDALRLTDHGGYQLGPAAKPLLKDEATLAMVDHPKPLRGARGRSGRGGGGEPNPVGDPLFEALRGDTQAAGERRPACRRMWCSTTRCCARWWRGGPAPAPNWPACRAWATRNWTATATRSCRCCGPRLTPLPAREGLGVGGERERAPAIPREQRRGVEPLVADPPPPPPPQGGEEIDVIRPITPAFAVAPQLTPDDVRDAAAQGFTTLVNNRPDRGGAGPADRRHHPCSGRGGGDDLPGRTHRSHRAEPRKGRRDAAALDRATGPVLAFCRSGTRSTFLWALARSLSGDDADTLIDQAAAAGYDITPIRPVLQRPDRPVSVWLLAGSLVAVLGLAGAARWLGLGTAEPLNEEEAADAVRHERPGTVVSSVRLAPDTMSATVATDTGEWEVRRHGVGTVVRPLP